MIIFAAVVFRAAVSMRDADLQRRRSELAMHEGEERYRLLVDSIRDYAILMLDREGCVASWNSGAERIKGYRAQEILGKHVSCFYLPDDIAQRKAEKALNIEVAGRKFHTAILRDITQRNRLQRESRELMKYREDIA